MGYEIFNLEAEFGEFNSTEFVLSALDNKGRDFIENHFGKGAVSATIPKSQFKAVWDAAKEKGLRIW